MESPKDSLTKAERKKLKAENRLKKELENLASLPESQTTVLCVKFGTKYGTEYVERLRNMVSRHLTVPYEIVCLTDDNRPIEGVRSIVQRNGGYQRGWWHKVHMFDSNLPLQGRILYFDLDVVIHRNIDKLALMFRNDFMGIQDFNRRFHPNWQYLNSSVLAWNHGNHGYIYNEFKSNPGQAQRMPGDQDWIWKLGKKEIKFWPRDWIQSYKWEIRKREELFVMNGKRQFREIKDDVYIHPECSIAVFHGDPNPHDVKDNFVVNNWC